MRTTAATSISTSAHRYSVSNVPKKEEAMPDDGRGVER